MGKVVKAVTNVKHGADDGTVFEYEPDDTLDIKHFTKEQLKSLFDAGAITMEETSDPEAVGPDTSAPEEPAVEEPVE
jgi:hypothetical protein